MTFGEKLKQFRLSNNLSASDLALKANISRGYLHVLENDGSNPSLDTIDAIAGVFGMRAGDLLIKFGYGNNVAYDPQAVAVTVIRIIGGRIEIEGSD